MLLCADLGNYSLTLGLFDGEQLVAQRSGRIGDTLEIKRLLTEGMPETAVLSSVNPPRIEDAIRDLTALGVPKPLIVGQDIEPPIENKCHQPDAVGMDRLMNAVAAYDLVRGECAVLDAGTAITVDVKHTTQQHTRSDRISSR